MKVPAPVMKRLSSTRRTDVLGIAIATSFMLAARAPLPDIPEAEGGALSRPISHHEVPARAGARRRCEASLRDDARTGPAGMTSALLHRLPENEREIVGGHLDDDGRS